jgi:isoleucyl-tRNA synthetase
VLDTIFEALVRYAAPVLVFTSEEVWGTRWPDKGSVHLLEWPEIGAAQEGAIEERWNILKTVREVAFASAEKSRTAKDIRTTLDAKINIILTDETIYNTVLSHFDAHDGLVSEIFISSEVNILRANPFEKLPVVWNSAETIGASVFASGYEKCGRCWRHLPEVLEDGDLCKRCKDVVHAS